MTESAPPSVPREPKLPKFDIEALFAAQKANLAAAQEAQRILIEAAQTIVKAQYDWTMDLLASGHSPWRGGRSANPEALVAEIQSTAEKTMAVAKQSVDVAAAAQQRVAELVVQRAAANFDELKTLAA